MFKIGEFSKIARTPITQLRYYDEIGLFSPAYTDADSGYRYYKVEQLSKLYRIIALKDLGLSLEQIGRMSAAEISPEEIRGMLTLKKAQIEQTIRDEVQRLRSVEARLRGMEQGRGGDDSAVLDGVVFKELPPTPILSVRNEMKEVCLAVDLMRAVNDFMPSRLGNHAGFLTVLMYGDAFDEVDVDCEIGYSLVGTHKPGDLALPGGELAVYKVLPAVSKAVAVVRHGPPADSPDIYALLGRWIDRNGYRIAGPSREVFLTPPRPGNPALDTIVAEIQWPVELRDGDFPSAQ